MKSIIDFIKNSLSHKLNQDIAWTFVSFFILAASGILMNVMIVLFRDSAALGIFNLSYSIYLIGSQLAVIGIHNSVMRYSAYHKEDALERGNMLSSAAILTLIFGFAFGLGVYLATPLFENIFGSAESARAIGYSGFGLMLFPLNKVLISYINGLRHMRALAILQTIRYITVLLGVAIISVSDIDFTYATFSFFAAEILTTILSLVYMAKSGLLQNMRLSRKWIKEHMVFGGKGALGSIFLDMNTRIDVLLIGMFLSDSAVGIYSFAAMLVDGLQHILSMLRVNFNPVLVATIRDKNWREAKKLLYYSKIYVFFGVILLSFMVIPAFYVFISYFVADKSLLEGWKILAILFFTYIIISGFTPFDNLLLASGFPIHQTIQNMSIAIVNIILGLILIPALGITGAAASTAISYLVGTSIMIFFSYKLLGWNMISNTTPDNAGNGNINKNLESK
ncbi:MAG: oligosaccharide flippase family protein [Rickettsiales bacterium]